MKAIFGHHTQNDFFKERVLRLNEQQEVCVTQHAKVLEAEAIIVEEMHTVQNYLIELSKNV